MDRAVKQESPLARSVGLWQLVFYGSGTILGARLPTAGGPIDYLTLALLVPLKSLAEMTSFAILIVFVGVNLSLIRMKHHSQPDDVPDIPRLIPVIGALSAAGALAGQIMQLASGGS